MRNSSFNSPFKTSIKNDQELFAERSHVSVRLALSEDRTPYYMNSRIQNLADWLAMVLPCKDLTSVDRFSTLCTVPTITLLRGIKFMVNAMTTIMGNAIADDDLIEFSKALSTGSDGAKYQSVEDVCGFLAGCDTSRLNSGGIASNLKWVIEQGMRTVQSALDAKIEHPLLEEVSGLMLVAKESIAQNMVNVVSLVNMAIILNDIHIQLTGHAQLATDDGRRFRAEQRELLVRVLNHPWRLSRTQLSSTEPLSPVPLDIFFSAMELIAQIDTGLVLTSADGLKVEHIQKTWDSRPLSSGTAWARRPEVIADSFHRNMELIKSYIAHLPDNNSVAVMASLDHTRLTEVLSRFTQDVVGIETLDLITRDIVLGLKIELDKNTVAECVTQVDKDKALLSTVLTSRRFLSGKEMDGKKRVSAIGIGSLFAAVRILPKLNAERTLTDEDVTAISNIRAEWNDRLTQSLQGIQRHQDELDASIDHHTSEANRLMREMSRLKQCHEDDDIRRLDSYIIDLYNLRYASEKFISKETAEAAARDVHQLAKFHYERHSKSLDAIQKKINARESALTKLKEAKSLLNSAVVDLESVSLDRETRSIRKAMDGVVAAIRYQDFTTGAPDSDDRIPSFGARSYRMAEPSMNMKMSAYGNLLDNAVPLIIIKAVDSK